MGTWGTGIFDNDGALDYVNEMIDSLAKRIAMLFADRDISRLDEDGETVLMPSVAMISLLIEQCHGVPPEHLSVSAWKADYLHIYDEQIDGLAPSAAYKIARRQTIEDTFVRLEQHIHKLWNPE